MSYLSLFLLVLVSLRIKALQVEPYTQKEAEAAGGMGSYVAPKAVQVSTQSLPTEMQEDT